MPAPINPDNQPGIMPLCAKALEIAQSQVGQCESPIGSNAGPMVNEYLKSVGLNPGYAWCQAFVHWCYGKAARQLNIPNPVCKTGGVLDCWNHTDEKKKVIKKKAQLQPDAIKPGDQFILLFRNYGGHTGIVEKIEGTVIHTIEGNSNNNGSREGYEVVRHQRNFTDNALIGFIQYT